ncbi:TfoX/Sxy family protein [Marinobacter zhejiangensis]|uniref:DNA transformation protein n=1 Tax=Marinobacter zhejiangensis TaxID=488535 RepID=A0A1I4NCJ7_9GAMM|nr:TfoX/Sxy family protein [Marinobacter zhejiangensis]SFM12953.1 DNA transformation protein [Marinobacter zhejiangensis]
MSEYTDYLQEVFAQFGPIRVKRMFGGYGVYHDDLMFALVADEVLYLKADDQCRPAFEQAGLPQFEYPKNGKLVKMSYYQAPEDMMEDPEEAAEWARRSFDAALRGRVKPR